MIRTLLTHWRRSLLCLLTILGSFLSGHEAKAQPAKGSCLVYVGTYTNTKKSKGIYAWRMDSSGSLSELGLVAETPNPTYLEIAPHQRVLYAVNEVTTFGGKSTGSVSAFAIDPATGKLTFLNQEPSGGPGPCHLTLDRVGKTVLVANYDGGSIEVLPVLADGRLGAPSAITQYQGKSVNSARQDGPHAHCVTLDPANHFAFVCDLGTDKIMSYRFDLAAGTLTPNEPSFITAKAGAGPRHLAFSADGKQAYVINELNSSITRYGFDATTGALTEAQTVSLLPSNFTGANTAAELGVHPSGKFLYGSNRGDDSIALFSIDPASGSLSFQQRIPTQGKTPRDFTIDPSGKYLFAANQNSDNIVIFKIDPANGTLAFLGQTLQAPAPVCIKFVQVP